MVPLVLKGLETITTKGIVIFVKYGFLKQKHGVTKVFQNQIVEKQIKIPIVVPSKSEFKTITRPAKPQFLKTKVLVTTKNKDTISTRILLMTFLKRFRKLFGIKREEKFKFHTQGLFLCPVSKV